MNKIMTYAVCVLNLGLMGAFSPAFGQGESPSSADTQAGYGSAASSPEAAGVKTSPAAAASGNGLVEVKLTEFHIDMPISVSAGATTFKVTNKGKETHGFEIEGNGIEKEIEPKLAKGSSGSLQVDLKPGTYKVYCPVDGHKMKGMRLERTVK